MTESEIRLEARLSAIEYLLSDLWVKWYILNEATTARVEKAHKETVERLRIKGFPGMPAALGDAFSAELESATADILSMQRAMLAEVNEKLGRS